MTCRKACSWMALAAGGDLSERRARRLEKHLSGCPACREERRQIEKSLELARSMAREERTPEWTDAEWRGVIGRAVGQEVARRKPSAAGVPGWAWAAGAALLVILVIGGAMMLRRTPGKEMITEQIARRDFILPEKAPLPAEPAPGVAAPAAKRPQIKLAPGTLLAQKPVQTGISGAVRPAAPAVKPQAQTVMAMTFVSQESGLKIYWVFNDAFDYKEERK